MGNDLDEALRAASEALGAPPAELEYEVLAEGRRGVLGIGARKVRIWVDLPDGTRALVRETFDRGATPEECSWVDETIRRIIGLMDLDLAVRTNPAAGSVRVDLSGPDQQFLLANQGEVLVALQFLLNRMARQNLPGAGRIQIECQGYRERRDRELIVLAREAARQVAQTGHPNWLGPLNPYERRLVHLAVREFPGLTSRSEGPGFLKKVQVSLEEPKGEA